MAKLFSGIVTCLQFAAVFGLFGFCHKSLATINRPVLFKVTSQKTQKVSYIFGTFHYGIGLKEFPEYMLKAIDSVDAVYVESKMSRLAELFKLSHAEPESALNEILKLQDIPKKKGDFTDAELDQLVALGIPRAFAEQMANDQCGFITFRKEFFSAEIHFLESEIENRALKLGKPVLELDSKDLSERAYSQEPESKCRVRNFLKNPTELLRSDLSLERIRNWYRNLTPETVLTMPADDVPSVTIRTLGWSRFLVPVLSERSLFLSVGLDHLLGESGLIQLLKKEQFTIDPMMGSDSK